MVRIVESIYGVEPGKKFGTRTAIGKPFSRGEHAWSVVLQCDCGSISVGNCAQIAHGRATHCRLCKKRYVKHGGAGGPRKGRAEPLYSVWRNMLNRCRNPNTPNFDVWGGRGISVCDEWTEYATFKEWALSSGYENGLEIDRYPDQSGDYEPNNCRWATEREQQRNKRTNRMVTAFGETKCIAEWLEDSRCLLTRDQIVSRQNRGLSGEESLTMLKVVRARNSNGSFAKDLGQWEQAEGVE